MTKNLYLTLLSLVFVSSSLFIQAENQPTAEQTQVIESMTAAELKDRRLAVEGKLHN